MFFLALVGMATQLVVSAVLGFAGTAITQTIKKYSGVDGNKALLLSLATSFVLTLISAWATGELTAEGISAGLAMVFSVSTLAYKTLLSSEGILANTSVGN